MSEKTVIIPQGYRITVHSWENDGDHRQTNIIQGLLYNEVNFYAKFCKLHYSKNGSKNKRGWGNLIERDEKEFLALMSQFYALIQEFKAVATNLLRLSNDDDLNDSDVISEIYHDLASDLFGVPGDSQLTRVFDGMVVEFFEWDVEGHVVTKEFV